MKRANEKIMLLDEPKEDFDDSLGIPAKVTRPFLPGVLQRGRLFDKLDGMRRHKVIWVSGPAGCGKTTLISSYLEARGLPCLWYNVDERDLDPATFFYYMGLAAKQAGPQNQNPLPFLTSEYHTGLVTFTLRYFENLYARLKGPCAVVIDNYQELSSNAKLHELLFHILAPIPEGLTVIIISREAPPGSLIRMRANRQMEELRWHDMRLSLEETKKIVGLQVKGMFSVGKIKRIHRAAGGWAAGLIMLLERAKIEAFDPENASDSTREEIFGYFAAEVFDSLDPENRNFFFKTAFLPHMTSEMAVALTGYAYAENILCRLNCRNQFTEKCGPSGNSYQYHPLFRQFLLSRAKETFSSKELSALRRNAASLLISAGETEEAVILLYDANDWDHLVNLILDHAPSMLAQGRVRLLGAWLEKLPIAMIENLPWVLFWTGACRTQFDSMSSRRYFEKAFEKFRAQGDKRGVFMAWACVINSIQLGFEDFSSLSGWLNTLEELLQEFKDCGSQDIEAIVLFSKVATLVLMEPHHPDMEALIDHSLSLAEGNLNNNSHIRLLHSVAFFRICTGDFEKAADVIEKLTRLASSDSASPIANITAKLMRSAYFEVTGRHEACIQAVNEGLEISRKSGAHILDNLLLGTGILSLLNSNDLAAARDMLQTLASFESSFKNCDRAFFYYLRFHESLWLGDFSRAAADAASVLQISIKVGSPISIISGHLAMARAMHELGRHRISLEHLGHVFRIAEEINSLLMKFHALLNEAQFLLDNGKEHLGLKSLRKALEIGNAKGYVTTHCIQAAALSKLCIKALDKGIAVPYVQNLIKKRRLIPVNPPLHLENWPWPLKIYTLGRFSLLKDGNPVQFSAKAQKMPLKMIKALISLGGRDVNKFDVCDALWPDAEGDKADQAFRTTLHRLRNLLGNEQAVQLQDGKLNLNPSYCWVDIWSFDRFLSQADEKFMKSERDPGIQLLEKAVDIYRGSFLVSDGWVAWAIPQRERLRNKFLFALSSLGIRFEEVGKDDQAMQWFFRALDSDILSEEIYQRLMLCLKRLGRRTEALAVYNSFRKTLKAGLGLDPSSKTEAIYRSLVSN